MAAFDVEEYAKKRKEEGKNNSFDVETYVKSKYASTVANDISSRVNTWLENNNNFIGNFNYRYSNGNTSYRADSSKWLSTITEQKSNFDQEAESIKSLLEEYKDVFDSEWVSEITRVLDANRDAQSKILEASTEDNNFWSQFKNEGTYNKWYSEEQKKQTIMSAEDFAEYSQKGASIENPSYREAEGTDTFLNWLNPFNKGAEIGNIVTFSRDNIDIINRALALSNSNADMASVLGDYRYQFMTDDEVSIYNYYLGKGDTENADAYLASLDDVLNQRWGGQMAENISGNKFLEMAFAVEAGLDQFASGVGNIDNLIKGTESDPVTPTQYANSQVREGIDGGWGVAYDLISTTSNMLPSILVGSLTGGIGGTLTMGTSVIGNAYGEMRNLGYDEWQSRGYAALVGAAEMGLQYALGGISKLGGKISGNAVSKLVSKFDNAIARTAIKIGGNMASEGLEEAIQTVLEPAFKALMTGEDFESPEWDEVFYSALLGALSAGVLEGVPTIAGTAIRNHQIKQHGQSILNTQGGADSLHALALEMTGANPSKEGQKIADLAGKVSDKASAKNVGRLSVAMQETFAAQDKADVKNALVKKGLSEKDATRVAEYLTSTTKLTDKQKAEIEGNENIKAVVSELLDNPKSAINERARNLIYARMGGYTNASNAASRATKSGEMAIKSEADVKDKVAESGKTTRISMGEEITINKDNAIAKTKMVDGERVVYLNTDHGVVEASDVAYASEDEGLIYESFSDMNPAFANAVIKNYDGSVPVQTYINGMREGILLYGMHNFQAVGKDISKSSHIAELSELDQNFALKLGRAYAKADAKKAAAPLRKAIKNAEKQAASAESSTTQKKVKGGKVSFENGAKATTKEQKKAVRFAKYLSNAIGIDIVFYDATIKGTYGSDSNGYFDEKTNSIHLDLQKAHNDTKTIVFTLSHEVVHFIKKWSPDKFNTFAKFLMEQYAEHGVDTSTLLSNKMAELGTTDADFAYEEMICDACETMLLDSNAVVKLMQLRQTDLSLFEKLKMHILELLNNLREAYRSFGYESTTDEAKALLKMTDVLEQLHSMFEDAAVDATQNFQTARPLNTESVSVSEDGTVRLQMKQYQQTGRATLLNYLREQYGNENANDLILTIDNIYDTVKEVKNDEALSVFSNWQDTEIELDENGHPIFTTSIKNGDYELNQDFSRVCKKRRQLDFVLNMLAEDPAFEASHLTKQDFVKINKAIKAHGFEIACALCFVDSKRFRQAEWADSFANTWNDILNAVVKDSSKLTPFNFATKTPNIADEGIEIDTSKAVTYRKWSDGKEDVKNRRSFESFDQLLSKDNDGKWIEGNTNVRTIATLIRDNPELRHTFRGADIIASQGFDTIQRLAPGIRSILDGWGGSSVPKPSSNDASYDNSIINMSGYNKETAYAMGGVRMNSFSDFMAHMFFDYCQAFADLSAKELPSQAYTKELIYVRLFGRSGQKMNMSGIAAIRDDALPTTASKGVTKAEAEANEKIEKMIAGLDVTRLLEHLNKDIHQLTDADVEQFLDMCDYVWADESINMKHATLLQTGILYDKLSESKVEECYELLKAGEIEQALKVAGKENVDAEYAKNCGTIVVGVSDAHISKLLRDPTVRMVIPYHKSGLNPVIARELRIAAYNDYTLSQSTAVKRKGAKASEKIGSTAIKDAYGLKDFEFYDWFGKTIDGKLYDGKATADKYLEWCEKGYYDEKVGDYVYYTTKGDGYILASDFHKKASIVPKFDAFVGEENYYKVLEDFDCYDTITGEHSAQGAVDFFHNGLPSDYKDVLVGALKEEQKVHDDFKDHLDNKGLKDEVMEIVKSHGYTPSDTTGTESGIKYQKKGVNKNGIEVYETSKETMDLSWKERVSAFEYELNSQYANKTARFVRNGHTYYAKLDEGFFDKVVYGESHFSKDGKKAFIKAGADGDVFDLIENTTYKRSAVDTKDHKKKDGFTDYFDYFFKTVQIDNKVFDICVNVKKQYGTKDGYTYTMFLVDNKKIMASPSISTQGAFKSEGNTITDGIIHQKEPIVKKQLKKSSSYAPTFYSQMGKVVDEIKMDKIAASSVVNYLKGKGIRHDEIKWSGIEAWLEGKKSVTKAELQEFVAGSHLVIEEEMSGEDIDLRYDGSNRAYNLYDSNGNIIDTFTYNEFIGGYIAESDEEIYSNNIELTEALREEYGIASAPRWADYTLNGGTNYRELVFKMPNSSYSNRAMRGHWGQDAEGILVHARIQDFDVNGKKMLFIEELQSDWHNEGMEKGYTTEEYEDAVATYDSLAKDYSNKRKAFNQYVRSSEFRSDPDDVSKKKFDWLRGKMETAEKRMQEAERHIGSLKEKGMGDVPDAPFHSTYHEYVLKRLLRMAAEEGYDSIGWTPADIQSKRWSYDYEKAYKIEYDQEMPKFLRKYGKKWGATVSTSTVSNDIEVWSMDITESMEQSVLYEGQAKFQKKKLSNRTVLANALESAAQNDAERSKLEQYKSKIALIESEQEKLTEVREKIKELSFAKGPRDTATIKNLQFEANQSANRINTYDKQLLNLEATAVLKGVLEREKQMAYKRAEQRGKEALAAYREKAAKTQRELMDRNTESRKKAIEGRHKTEIKNKIKSITAELNNLLLKPTAKKHIKEELRREVAEALSAINMDTVGADERVAKYNALIAREKDPDIIAELTKTRDNIQLQGDNLKEKLTTLQSAYEKIKNTDDIELNLAYQEVIQNSIKSVTEKVGNTSIRNMTLEQLEMVYDLLSMIRKTIRDANKSFTAKKGETIMQMAEAVNDQVRTVGGQPYKRNAIVAGLQKIGWTFLKPYIAFRTIGSVTLTNLYKELRAGEDTFYADVSEAQAFIEGQYTKHGYKAWDMKKTKTFTAKSGKTFDLTLEQMMTLYAYSRREQAHKHIIEGGIVFENAMIVEKNKVGIPIKYEVTTKDAFNLSEETLGEIVNSLSTEQKAFVDEMQAYLSDTMGAKGNEVSMELLGVKLFKERFYLPIKSSQYYMNFKAEEAGEVKLRSPAFSKETVQHANNPIVLHSFTDLWAEHINDMSMYHSFVLALEDFTRVYNYKTKTDAKVETMDTKATLETAYAGSTKYISKFLKDMNGGVRSETVGWAEKLTSLAKKGAVLGSASVAIQQPSAIMRAMAYINPKYFVTTAHKSMNLAKHKQDFAELKKYAPIAGIKEMGRFDVGMGQGTVDWIKSNQTVMEKAEEFIAIPPAYMDEVTWVSIWNAVKRETMSKHHDLSPTSEEFLKIAGERFTEVISLSQVYDSVFARSDLMRNKSWIAKSLTAFMAEPTTTLNMLWDSWVQGKRTGSAKGFVKATASAGGAIVAATVLNAALKSIIMAMRDDDEDESYAEKYLEHFAGDIKDNLNPLTLVPFAKDIVSIFNGYDVERMDMALFSDFKKAIDAFDSDGKSEYEKWSGFIGATSAFFGVPIKNVERDVRGLINSVFGESASTTDAGVRNALAEGWTGEKKSDGQQLYEAMVSGDNTQIERVKGRFKDQKAINSAIRKALRENDPRIKEAAVAKNNGDIAEYMRIAKEIIAEGHFNQDDIVAAINAEISALNKEGETTESTDTVDEVTSIYSSSDINTAFENGNNAMALTIIDDLVNVKTTNYLAKAKKEAEEEGKLFNESEARKEAESKAKASVKSSMTSYWKPLYKKAYKENNTAEMARIRKILSASQLYGKSSEILETCKKWLNE